jgi:hypothetical protein
MLARIISVLISCFISTVVLAEEVKPSDIADGAPDRYVVLPGDTLWGISARFLKEPFRWPEVWRLNRDQVKNPHRIYPGEVIMLEGRSGEPQLKLGEMGKGKPVVIVEDTRKEGIPSIPQNVIEPFLSQPLVVDEDGLRTAPRIIATQEDRVYVGSDNRVYVTGVKSADTNWQVYRPAKALVDPDTAEILGYEAFYLGSARQTREGEPATFEIATARQEIGRGDRFVVATRPEIVSYVPHAPGAQVAGRLISVYGGLGEGGRYSVVSLSRGLRDGLEIGHVLALYRAGAEVTERFEGKKTTYKLPEERYGLVFVFRLFDRVSYALVMDASRPIMVGDAVRTP